MANLTPTEVINLHSGRIARGDAAARTENLYQISVLPVPPSSASIPAGVAQALALKH